MTTNSNKWQNQHYLFVFTLHLYASDVFGNITCYSEYVNINWDTSKIQGVPGVNRTRELTALQTMVAQTCKIQSQLVSLVHQVDGRTLYLLLYYVTHQFDDRRHKNMKSCQTNIQNIGGVGTYSVLQKFHFINFLWPTHTLQFGYRLLWDILAWFKLIPDWHLPIMI